MSFQDFQKAPNRLTQRDVGFLIIATLALALVIYVLAITNNYLANLWPEGGEFALLRAGGRAFLFDRIEPYSGTVPAVVQEQVYGRPAAPGEDLYILDIPFHLLLFYFPLALFPEAGMARAFWMALSEIALAGFIAFSFRLADRRVPYVFIGLIVLSGLSSFYAYRSLLEGSPVFLLALAYTGMLLSLRAGHDEVAGALMAFASFQWEIGGLFLFFVTLWVFWEKRWRVFAGAGMLAFVLLLVSFLWYPGWLLPFLRAAWNSYRAGVGFSIHSLFEDLWPQSGASPGWILTAVLLLVLGVEWFAARGKHFHHFLWTACLTIAVTPLLGQRVELELLFPLTLPIMLVVIITRERWKKVGDGVGFLLLWFFFGLPWILYFEGLPERFGLSTEQFLFVFWPLFSVLGLYWTRWWMVHPPRTWLDRFAYKEWG